MDININSIKTPFTESDLEKIIVPPDWKKVYHITSVTALEKIVSERIIRFVALSNVNDKAEISNYFKELNPVVHMMPVNSNDFNSAMDFSRQTSFSFSTSYIAQSDPDFWNEYSKGSCGVCIEFNLKKLIESVLEQNFDKLKDSKLYYGQVVYDKIIKVFFLHNSINYLKNNFRKMLGLPLKHIANSPIFTIEEVEGRKNCRQLVSCLPTFSKDFNKWAKEKEVRICFYHSQDGVLKSVEGKTYIPMVFDPSCIEGITLSPGAPSECIEKVEQVKKLIAGSIR